MMKDPHNPWRGFRPPSPNEPADLALVLIITAALGACFLIAAMIGVHLIWGPVR